VLQGREDVELASVDLDGSSLNPSKDYKIDFQNHTLTIFSDAFRKVGDGKNWKVKLGTIIRPQNNTRLEGLYASGTMLCTQCEAEGFRGITFFLDRPDVMSQFSVTIKADKEKFPVLLSNGNLVREGHSQGNELRHFAEYNDPFPKSCYLFALVAGKL